MSFALERKLIEGAYRAGMPTGSVIEFENVPLASTGTAYTRLSVMSGGEGKRLGVTATTQKRVPGAIDVAIFTQHDIGTASLRAIADLVTIALADKTLTEGQTRITTFGARLDIIGRSGDWFQGNVTIRYERDST